VQRYGASHIHFLFFFFCSVISGAARNIEENDTRRGIMIFARAGYIDLPFLFSLQKFFRFSGICLLFHGL